MPWEAPQYWTHPEGEFPAQLVKWEEFAHPKFGQMVKWTFETDVHRDDDKPPWLSRSTSMTLSAKSIAGEIILALGFDIPPPNEIPNFNADVLCGHRCIILVEHDHQADGSVWANIKAFKPMRKQATGGGFQAGGNTKDRAPKPSQAAAQEATSAGCPEPDYDHSLKPGQPGYDPFHSETCPLMPKDKKAA